MCVPLEELLASKVLLTKEKLSVTVMTEFGLSNLAHAFFDVFAFHLLDLAFPMVEIVDYQAGTIKRLHQITGFPNVTTFIVHNSKIGREHSHSPSSALGRANKQ